MLVALGGLFAGYTGGFEFESGAKYPEALNYGVMRAFLALFGVAMVPVAFLTGVELGFSRRAAWFFGALVLLGTSRVLLMMADGR